MLHVSRLFLDFLTINIDNQWGLGIKEEKMERICLATNKYVIGVNRPYVRGEDSFYGNYFIGSFIILMRNRLRFFCY